MRPLGVRCVQGLSVVAGRQTSRLHSGDLVRWLPGHGNWAELYVHTLQKPMVDAIQRLGVTHQVQRLLDGIDRILFVVQSNDDQPFKVELILMRNERLGEHAVDELGVSELVGWMENVLRERGNATIVHWHLYDSGSISLRDYASAYPLALDHYTLLADAEAADRDVFRPLVFLSARRRRSTRSSNGPGPGVEVVHVTVGKSLEVIAHHAFTDARLLAYLALAWKRNAVVGRSSGEPQQNELAGGRQRQVPNPASNRRS